MGYQGGRILVDLRDTELRRIEYENEVEEDAIFQNRFKFLAKFYQKARDNCSGL